jgi:branched-chain amino acid transport system substrate-binding protein
MRKLIIFLFGLALFFPNTILAQDTIRIGMIQPLTGSVALDGQAAVDGARLAVEQINAKGGVTGKKLELFVEDGMCKPNETRAAAEKLITKDKVPVLIGAFCSTATLAAKPVSTKYGIPLVNAISISPKLLEEPIQYFFRMPPGDDALAKASVKYFVNETKVKSVCILAVNDDWGRNATKFFGDFFEAEKVKILGKDLFTHGETDYVPFIVKIKGLNPDGLFVVAEAQDGALLFKQMNDMKLKKPTLGTGAIVETHFIKLAGQDCEGIYGSTEWAPGIQDPLNIAFMKDFAARYPQIGTPGKYPAAGYDAVIIIAEAIKRAGGTDPEKLANEIAKTRMQLLHGRDFHFNEQHRGVAYVVVTQIKDGKVQILRHVPTE